MIDDEDHNLDVNDADNVKHVIHRSLQVITNLNVKPWSIIFGDNAFNKRNLLSIIKPKEAQPYGNIDTLMLYHNKCCKLTFGWINVVRYG